MLFNRVRFWGILLLLSVYLVGILVLSVISLHDNNKHGRYRDNFDVSHQNVEKSKTADFGVPGFRPPSRRSKISWCSDLKYVDPPGETIALASFPGSGNTWLRYLLQQATGFYTGSVYKDYGLLKNGFPAESVMNGSVLVVKTHEWGQKSRNKFSKAILLVRAPAASIQAEFNRQSGGHIGFASPDRYKRLKGRYWQQFVDDKLKAWRQMNLDWLRNFTGPTHVMLYEHLVADVAGSLRPLLEFVGGRVDERLFRCALRRREGVYRRKRRALAFDPFDMRMRERIGRVQGEVYDAIDGGS